MWRWLRRDPWQAFILLLAPAVLVAALYSVFAARLPVALPVGWIDQEQIPLSRQLGRQLEASPVITLHSFADEKAAQTALATGEIYALVQIPAGFGAALRRQQGATIDVRYNGQYLLLARRLSAPLQQALGSELQQQAALSLTAQGVPLPAQAAQLAPIRVQLTAENNQSLDYAAFLVPPLALSVWQVLVLFALLNLLQRPPPGHAPMRWLVPVMLWMWLWGGAGLWLMRPLLGLPSGAGLMLPWLGLLPLMVPLATVAMLLVRTGKEAVQLVSTGAAFLTPAMTYMGVTMPEGDMPWAAQWWAQWIPSSHYMPLLQSYSGIGTADWLSLWPMLLPLPVMGLLIWRFQREAV
ncbi:ABC transporter permease [Ferrimonas pelagia]|uniref:ABC transporter permease n=1 Tax=Ferrimonas pelagia TaxID=1177826 RepID=A0ABP9FFX0_9GAMM